MHSIRKILLGKDFWNLQRSIIHYRFRIKRLEIQLRKDEFSQEEKKQINELLKSNAIMKKYLGNQI